MERELTFGEKLVGLDFNPSGNDKVTKAKQLCAELADLINEHCCNVDQTSLSRAIETHTYGQILNAQMNAVKILTLKY